MVGACRVNTSPVLSVGFVHNLLSAHGRAPQPSAGRPTSSSESRCTLRIILAGPGAPNWFHLSILKQQGGASSAAPGFDVATYHSLPFTNAAKTAMGADTMVLDVASAETATPWRVTLVNDSLLSKTQTEAAANRNKRKWEELTGTAACKKAVPSRERDRGQSQPYNFWKGDMWNGM